MRSEGYPHKRGTCRSSVIPAGEEPENHFPLLFRALYTAGNRGKVRMLPQYDRVSNPQDFTAPAQRNGGAFAWGIRTFCPMKRLSGRPAETPYFAAALRQVPLVYCVLRSEWITAPLSAGQARTALSGVRSHNAAFMLVSIASPGTAASKQSDMADTYSFSSFALISVISVTHFFNGSLPVVLREAPDTCGSVHKYRYIYLLMRLPAWHRPNPDISTDGLCLPDIYKIPAASLSASGITPFPAFCGLPAAGGEKSACFLRKFMFFFQAAYFFFLPFDLSAQDRQFLCGTHCRLWRVRAGAGIQPSLVHTRHRRQ